MFLFLSSSISNPSIHRNADFSKPWFGWKKDGSVAQDLGDMTYEEVTWRVRRGSYMYGTWVVKGCGLPRSWASQFIMLKMVRNGFLVAGILSHTFFCFRLRYDVDVCKILSPQKLSCSC